eukprot:m.84941 g.84941  ORF g.84941 m.84941 type:complete len:124 (-) comp12176_c1_seq1:1283-1654(-)
MPIPKEHCDYVHLVPLHDVVPLHGLPQKDIQNQRRGERPKEEGIKLNNKQCISTVFAPVVSNVRMCNVCVRVLRVYITLLTPLSSTSRAEGCRLRVFRFYFFYSKMNSFIFFPTNCHTYFTNV